MTALEGLKPSRTGPASSEPSQQAFPTAVVVPWLVARARGPAHLSPHPSRRLHAGSEADHPAPMPAQPPPALCRLHGRRRGFPVAVLNPCRAAPPPTLLAPCLQLWPSCRLHGGQRAAVPPPPSTPAPAPLRPAVLTPSSRRLAAWLAASPPSASHAVACTTVRPSSRLHDRKSVSVAAAVPAAGPTGLPHAPSRRSRPVGNPCAPLAAHAPSTPPSTRSPAPLARSLTPPAWLAALPTNHLSRRLIPHPPHAACMAGSESSTSWLLPRQILDLSAGVRTSTSSTLHWPVLLEPPAAW